MTVITEKPLPNGSIPFHQIGDAINKDVVMKLNENIISLKRQLVVVQKAVQELQKRR